MTQIHNPDLSVRDRTLADRRGFVLGEQTLAMAEEIRQRNAAPEAKPLEAPGLSKGELAGRERRSLREAATAQRRRAALRAIAETVYAAIPMDDHEKGPSRDVIVEQATAFAEDFRAEWELSPAGVAITEAAMELAGADDAATDEAVRAAAADGSSVLGAAIRESASQVEGRVVAAYLEAKTRAEETERALAEAAEGTTDPDLIALRQRKIRRGSQTLMESLFSANRTVLSESADREIPADVVLAEAVAQYTLIEGMSALGVARITHAGELASKIALLSKKAA